MLCSAPPEVILKNTLFSIGIVEVSGANFFTMLNWLQDVKRFKVGDPRSFHYLNQTNCYEVANVDDAREYIETRNAMDIVGIDQEEQVRHIRRRDECNSR